MNPQILRILIAENQLFIALEAERIIRAACECEISICRRDHLDATLAEQSFDLVILELSDDPLEYAFNAKLIGRAGADFALLCASRESLFLIGELVPVAVIEKPFNERRLAAFIAQYAAATSGA